MPILKIHVIDISGTTQSIGICIKLLVYVI